MDSWHVYILKCSDTSLYTGVTTDLERRVKEHDSGKGARYTKARRPVSLMYSERHGTRADAQRRESEIKKMTRRDKLRLIRTNRQ